MATPEEQTDVKAEGMLPKTPGTLRPPTAARTPSKLSHHPSHAESHAWTRDRTTSRSDPPKPRTPTPGLQQHCPTLQPTPTLPPRPGPSAALPATSTPAASHQQHDPHEARSTQRRRRPSTNRAARPHPPHPPHQQQNQQAAPHAHHVTRRAEDCTPREPTSPSLAQRQQHSLPTQRTT